jgi:hypothetical protein
MDTEASLLSIRRWLMIISLLLVVQVYYSAQSNYSVPPGGNTMILGLLGLGFVVVGSLALSFFKNQ